jgi:hypothetical protein
MPVLLILATLGICKRILYVGHFCFSVCIICKVFLKIVFKKQSFVPRCISISIKIDHTTHEITSAASVYLVPHVYGLICICVLVDLPQNAFA